MRIGAVAAVAGCLAVAGCAPHGSISSRFSAVPLTPPDGPVSAELRGGEIVAVQNLSNTVAVYVKNGQVEAGLGADLFISVTNRGNRPLTLDAANVSLQAISGGGRVAVALLPPDEVKTESVASVSARAAATTTAGAVNAFFARTYGGRYSVTTPVYAGGTYVGDLKTTGYDGVSAARAEAEEKAETRRRLGVIAAERVEAVRQQNAVLLGRVSIKPGETVVAMIRTRPNSAADSATDLLADIHVGGEDYPFDYRLSRN